jgi:DNA polymerase III alpha subunit
MRRDKVGRVVLDTADCVELLYNDNFQDNIVVDVDSDVDLYNKYTYIMNTGHSVLEQVTEVDSIEEFDKLNQDNWFMPVEYKDLDIVMYLLEKASEKKDPSCFMRTGAELEVYKKRGLLNLLRFLMYLVDTMKKRNIVWGVGRGSSVASYVLFLLGVHKVDSIKYELDFKEFLKGE